MYKALIFSDLDGTLLHYKTFGFNSLVEYIWYLEKKKYLLIPVSSKTYQEIKMIIKKIKICLPFCAENGACSYVPAARPYKKTINFDYKKIESDNSKNIQYIEKIINSKRFYLFRNSFFRIKKLNYNQIYRITSLRGKGIANFLNREFSIPIIWKGDKELFKTFVKNLNRNQLDINFGGKIFNISGKAKKVDGIKVITRHLLKNSIVNKDFFSIGLGDSNNDIEMLNYTDYSCVIKKFNGQHLKLPKKKIFAKSTMIAPSGWKEVMTKIYNFKENIK